MPEESSYTLEDLPSNKRYELSRSEALRTLPREFKQALFDTQIDNPEIKGATLFGSTVKGVARESSDVDSYIFIDRQQAQTHLTKDDYAWADEQLSKKSRLDRDTLATDHHYREIINTKMTERGLSTHSLEGIKIRLIDEKSVEEEISKQIEYQQNIQEYEQQMNEHNKKTHELPIDQWPEQPKYPEYVHLPDNMRALFHLQLGQGLNPYRKQILDKLEGQGEVGQKVWKGIIHDVADLERNFHGGNYGDLYPQTISEAKNTYNIQ